MFTQQPLHRRKRMLARRWSRLGVVLHWLIALLLLVVLGAVFATGFVPAPQARKNLMALHTSAGLLLFVLFLLKLLCMYFSYRAKEDTHDWSDWTDWIAQGAHTLIYALLFMLPMLGWAHLNALGQDAWFAGLRLPRLIPFRNPDLAYTLQDFHSSAAWVLIIVVVLHVLAAFWHHFLRRDDVLRAMLPGWKKGN